MDKLKPKLAFSLAPLLSGACLIGYLLLDVINLNVRVLVVFFWLAVLACAVSMFLKSGKRVYKYVSIFLVPALLFVPSMSIFAWTSWWIGGFGP